MTLTEFLLARLAEDEEHARPQTVVISGGTPAPEVPNCAGVDYQGCEYGWQLDPEPVAGWWRRDDVQQLIARHELTHATPQQRRVLADCEAKRRIVEQEHLLVVNTYNVGPVCSTCWTEEDGSRGPGVWPCPTLRLLALPYADHPDFQPEWRR